MKSLNEKSNHHFRYSILVNNSQEKVWHFLTSVNRWKEWDTELRDAVLFEEFDLGVKGVLIPKKGPKLKFHISELIPDKSYTFVTKMPVGALKIKRTLQEKDGKIEFEDDIRFTGFFKRIFGLILGGGFKAVLPEVLNNFKRIAEQE